MKKSKILFLIIIVLAIAAISYTVYDGYNYAPSRIKTNYYTIEHEKINEDLDNLQVAFISDIHYLTYFNNERLEQLVSKLNDANPDIIVFVGDLVDREMNEEEYTVLNEAMHSLNPKYGKFAVLGEADYASETINNQVETLLFDSNFEILKNEVITISKDSQNVINLVGLDSVVNTKHDIEKAFVDVNDKNFTIALTHAPDIADKFPEKLVNLVIAGHSHGGQINIPLLGQVYNKPYAENYFANTYNFDSIKLHVINGVGTTVDDVRINAPAEIVIYTFRSK